MSETATPAAASRKKYSILALIFISVVIKRLYREEFKSLTDNRQRNRLKRFRSLLHREYPAPDQASLFSLNSGLDHWPRLKTAYQMKVKLTPVSRIREASDNEYRSELKSISSGIRSSKQRILPALA